MTTPINPSKNQSTYFINPERGGRNGTAIASGPLAHHRDGRVFPEGLDLKPEPISCWI